MTEEVALLSSGSDSSQSSPMFKRSRSGRFLQIAQRSLLKPNPRRLFRVSIILGMVASILISCWIAFNLFTLIRVPSNQPSGLSYNNFLDPEFSSISTKTKNANQDNISGAQIDHPLPPATDADHLYGVVFDAGSTGSRVHVFELIVNHSDLTRPYILKNEIFEQVKPGLSAFANKPEEAADSLNRLIQIAEESIPPGQCSRTPLILRATAGLRLLSLEKADNILNSVRRRLSNTCFPKSPNAVTILDGLYEGLYVWISLNFLINRLSNPNPDPNVSPNLNLLSNTVGALDLGGGSTQITFAPTNQLTLDTSPNGFLSPLNSLSSDSSSNMQTKSGYQIYSHSYLGLGMMSARYSMLHTATRRSTPEQNTENNLYYPCWPENFTTTWEHSGLKWNVHHMPRNITIHLLSDLEKEAVIKSLGNDILDNNFSLCYAFALNVLRNPVEGDRNVPVHPPHGYIVHQVPEFQTREFYAFSYFFDLATDMGLVDEKTGGRITVSGFRQAAEHACDILDKDHPFRCMDLSFITALLHDGYGFAWDKTIQLQKKVGPFEITWSLGALFGELFRK